MPDVPKNAKKPADHAKKKTEGDSVDPTLKFERDGRVYESLPMSEAMTPDLVIDQPDPETMSDWEKLRFSLRLTLSAFRDDPEAIAHVKQMSLREVAEMEDQVKDEAGVELGESSSSSS